MVEVPRWGTVIVSALLMIPRVRDWHTAGRPRPWWAWSWWPRMSPDVESWWCPWVPAPPEFDIRWCRRRDWCTREPGEGLARDGALRSPPVDASRTRVRDGAHSKHFACCS